MFARLSAIGYAGVEFAGYSAGPPPARRYTNAEIRALLRKYHLKAFGSHVNYYSADPAAYSFVTQLEQVLDDAEEIGMRYIGTASRPGQRYGETVDGYRRAAEDFNTFGAAARARGLRFYHHHHSEEYALEGDTRLYDVLLEETDPRLVFLEFEIFWSHVGQSRYPGRQAARVPVEDAEALPAVPRQGRHRLQRRGGHGPQAAGPTHPPRRPTSPLESAWVMTDVGDGDIAFEPLFCGLDTTTTTTSSSATRLPTRSPTRRASTHGEATATTYLAGLRERRGGGKGRHHHHG